MQIGVGPSAQLQDHRKPTLGLIAVFLKHFPNSLQVMNMYKNNQSIFALPLIASILLMGATSACGEAKTDAQAPNSTDTNGRVSTSSDADATKADAQSSVRQDQISSDIRARAQRNSMGGDGQQPTEGDLASEVRNKLETNLLLSKLTVSAKNADVTISGVVKNQQDLDKIKPLAMEIKGVRGVTVKAVVSP